MKYTLEQLNQASQNTLAGTLEIKIIEATPGKIVLTMPVNARVHQPMGLLHGGASVALAETAASMGGWLLVAEENKVVVGQEINANHLRSIKEGLITAYGEIVYQGRKTQVWEIKIFNEEKNSYASHAAL